MAHDRSNGVSTFASVDRRSLLLGTTAGLTVAAVSGVSVLTSSPALAAPEIGKPAPDFSVVDSNGKTQSLSDLRGKIIALEWTNHDCPYVRKHYNSENMQKLQRQAAEAGVTWLSVISSPPGEQGNVTPAKANELTQSRKAAPAAVLLDPTGRMARAYDARTTPHMFLINAEGALVYKGGIDSIASTRVADLAKATPYFRDALVAVTKGELIRNAVTRPYGCAVKYTS